jgi:hypothetical protein
MKVDDWMPEYAVRAGYSILVRASPEKTFDALAAADFGKLPVVRGLMWLRGYGGRSAEAQQDDRASPLARRYGAFLELDAVPQREILVGIAGRFWRPDGGIVRGLSPAEFAAFHAEGYARGVWNFSLSAVGADTRLATETRVQTFGRAATTKFRLYWLLVGPFSGLIRHSMLREIKRIAEQAP